MKNIIKAVRRIVEQYEEVIVIYPIHKNFKVRKIAQHYLSNNERIELIESLSVINPQSISSILVLY